VAIAAIGSQRAKINKNNRLRRKRKPLVREGAIVSQLVSKRSSPTVRIKVVVTIGREMSVDMRTMIKSIAGAEEGKDEEVGGEDTKGDKGNKTMRVGTPATTLMARTKRETISSIALKHSKTRLRSSLGAAIETIITGHTIITEEMGIIIGSSITETLTGHTTATTTGTTTTTKVTIIEIGIITEIMIETIRPRRTTVVNGPEAITNDSKIDSPTSPKRNMSRQKQKSLPLGQFTSHRLRIPPRLPFP
jgi:hypothetical protein